MVVKKKVSIIIPTYNEKENITLLISLIENIFQKGNRLKEIIVVDDKSPDGTGEAVLELKNTYKNIRLIIKEKKEGIGAALREGYNAAKGDIILSSDADLSFSVGDMKKLVEKIDEGYDLVVGARHINEEGYQSNNIKTAIKRAISKYGNKIVVLLLRYNIHDFSANFRAMKKEVWHSINTQENTNALLLEMIIKAHQKRFKVTEIPVIFKDRIYGQSKLNLWIEAPKFFVKVIKFSLKRQ
ncbi:MAG: glycosyltransferase [Candidatus Woesearchaeota archaeon]|jgi:dolichol-phosphate mannosyltransferase